jgi:hypothetical protein
MFPLTCPLCGCGKIVTISNLPMKVVTPDRCRPYPLVLFACADNGHVFFLLDKDTIEQSQNPAA